MTDKIKVLYHANCLDGSGAAYVAWRFFDSIAAQMDYDIEYIPVQYGKPPPDNLTDCQIYIVDFSYPRQTLIDMADKASSITVIDHHKTSQEDLKDLNLPNGKIIFDMNHSGAILTWKYFFPGKIPPMLLMHIEDRDLWKFEYVNTKTVTAGLMQYPDFKSWEQFIYSDRLHELAIEGSAITKFINIQIEKIIQTPPILFPLESIIVPYYNVPGFMISECLHQALIKYPECLYAVGYFDLLAENKRVYSVRSNKETDVDVSLIAKKWGGGGHKSAAAFSIPLSSLSIIF